MLFCRKCQRLWFLKQLRPSKNKKPKIENQLLCPDCHRIVEKGASFMPLDKRATSLIKDLTKLTGKSALEVLKSALRVYIEILEVENDLS